LSVKYSDVKLIKPDPVIVTVEPTGPLVGLMLVIVGGALGLTVPVGVGTGDALGVDVGRGEADAAGVACADGKFVLPPEHATTLANRAITGNNAKRPRTNIRDPRASAVASGALRFLYRPALPLRRKVSKRSSAKWARVNENVAAPDWTTVPEPIDDGAAKHLAGMRVPAIALLSTAGGDIDLSKLTGRTILYAYPRTGAPGIANPDGWDAIPGARGCSPQSCAFRDHYAELRASGVSHVFGISTQDTAYQREAAERLALPFPLLSDEALAFALALRLPTFEAAGMTLLKRCTLVIDDGVITHTFYPVFPPDRNARDVLDWLRTS
jgi:peroxiredoxin